MSEKLREDLIAWFFILVFIVVMLTLGITHH